MLRLHFQPAQVTKLLPQQGVHALRHVIHVIQLVHGFQHFIQSVRSQVDAEGTCFERVGAAVSTCPLSPEKTRAADDWDVTKNTALRAN